MGDRESIRKRIADNALTYKWIIRQLDVKCGIKTDKSEFSSALSETRYGPKIESIIQLSNLILDEYERYFANRPIDGETDDL